MGNTIPLVNTSAFDKSIKSSGCAYMIFVKDVKLEEKEFNSLNDELGSELDLSRFLSQFQDIFIDDIPRELPLKRGDDE